MNIAVKSGVEVHHRRPALRIVVEVHLVASPGQMRHRLAVQGVVRCLYRAIRLRHLLLRAQAVVIVSKLHHILRLAGEQLALRRNAPVQLRARAFYFAILQGVYLTPAGRYFQLAILDCENVVRVQAARRVARVHVLIYGDASVRRPASRQRAADLHVPAQVRRRQRDGLLPRVRRVPRIVCARVPAVALPRKGAGCVFACHVFAVSGHLRARLRAGHAAGNQVAVAPRNLQHRAALLVYPRLCAFLQVGLYVYLLQLPARLPLVAPSAIVQRIADCVIRDGLAIVGRQLVLPVVVRVGVQDGIMRHPRRSRGVGMVRLRKYVPTAVVVVQPCGTALARRGVVRVVYADELPQRVVAVCRHLAVAVLLHDVSPAVIFVGEVHRVGAITLTD